MDKRLIPLDKLCLYYETYLCDKIFKYQLNNKIDIEIKFYKENLCHLLGIQHVINDKNYLGLKGYNKIKKLKLTYNFLKKYNKKGFKNIELKLLYFNKIFDMLNNCKILKFYQYRVFPPTTIIADFLMCKDNQESIMHLFLRKERDSSNEYSPISYIVKTKNDKNIYQFIKGQEYKKITYFKIIDNKIKTQHDNSELKSTNIFLNDNNNNNISI
jgi:hypothetical protein